MYPVQVNKQQVENSGNTSILFNFCVIITAKGTKHILYNGKHEPSGTGGSEDIKFTCWHLDWYWQF